MYPQPHITQTVSTHFEAMATPIHRSAVPSFLLCHMPLDVGSGTSYLRQLTAALLNTPQMQAIVQSTHMSGTGSYFWHQCFAKPRSVSLAASNASCKLWK